MKRKYTEELIADMLLLQGAYLKTEQNKDKDAEYIREMYNVLVPKRIREIVSKHRDSFEDAKYIRKHLFDRSNEFYEELIRSSSQRGKK